MSTTNEKLTAFAQAVGADIKALTEKVASVAGGGLSTSEVQALIDDAIATFKSQITGGELAAELDTLAELAAKITSLDDNVTNTIIAKLTELSTSISDIENVLNTDLVTVYTTARDS